MTARHCVRCNKPLHDWIPGDTCGAQWDDYPYMREQVETACHKRAPQPTPTRYGLAYIARQSTNNLRVMC
jgi:hypothetical protein